MRWFRSVRLALIASASVLACDSGPDPLPASTFTDPPPNALDIVGHVHIGTERVAAALVRVDPSPGATVDPLLLAASETNPKFARTVTADAAGAYRLPFNPSVYDLSITHD
ncbi:MAG: hypothetical protein QOI41_7377, partial [Myxococcales bacterium]|nr:hypothetical protein [Myxococcales bacterium]